MHLYIKNLFCARTILNKQLARRLKGFIENWKILTNDTEILQLAQDYTIPFHEVRQQQNILNSDCMFLSCHVRASEKIHTL